MKVYQQKLIQSTALSSLIFLSACGGGSDNSGSTTADNQTQPFQSGFSSSLTIEEKFNNGSKKYNVQNKLSNEKDSVLAYSVTTELANTFRSGEIVTDFLYPQLHQLINFNIEENNNNFDIEIGYDPLLKEPTFFTLTRKSLKSNNTKQTFFCRESDTIFNDVCSGLTINYDDTTGTTDIRFNQSEFKSADSDPISFTLNGALKGTLSAAPQTVQNIPKTSHGSVIVDGKAYQIMAAFNNPEQIMGPKIFDAGISVLIDNTANISFTKNGDYLNSRYFDTTKNYSPARPDSVKNLTFKNLQLASQFTLQPTIFNFYNFGNEPAQQSVTISATVDALTPQQALTIRPTPSKSLIADQNNSWYSDQSLINSTSIPNNFSISLINHNIVTIQNQNITATLQDHKLQSVQLHALVLKNSASAITRFISIDYQCGEVNSACKGIQVEPNGFGVKFNNTVLTNTSPNDDMSDNPLPPTITLNGGLVYLGR